MIIQMSWPVHKWRMRQMTWHSTMRNELTLYLSHITTDLTMYPSEEKFNWHPPNKEEIKVYSAEPSWVNTGADSRLPWRHSAQTLESRPTWQAHCPCRCPSHRKPGAPWCRPPALCWCPPVGHRGWNVQLKWFHYIIITIIFIICWLKQIKELDQSQIK